MEVNIKNRPIFHFAFFSCLLQRYYVCDSVHCNVFHAVCMHLPCSSVCWTFPDTGIVKSENIFDQWKAGECKSIRLKQIFLRFKKL